MALIIPCLNEAAGIDPLLQQLQKMRISEVLFVDGGSDDDTVARIRRAGFRCLHSRPGRAIQMNMGATACAVDVLWFVHADTEFSEAHMADIRHVMCDPDVVGGRFDVRFSGRHPWFRVIAWLMNKRSRVTRISTGDQAIFVRRSVFEQLSGFPEQPLMEDIEFSRQLKRRGRIACLRRPVITSSRRWEKHGIGRTIFLMWKLRLFYWLGIPAEKLAAMYNHAR